MSCMNLFAVGAIYVIMRISEGIFGLMFAGITDRIGRRKSCLYFLPVNLLAQAVIIFSTTYYGKLAGYILYAASNTKISLSFLIIFELVESSKKPWCCTIVNTLDTMTMVVFGFYLLFISKNWFPLCFSFLIIDCVALVVFAWAIPETPKWLLINGKIDDAIDNLNYIAKFNGSANRIPKNA
jgi:MFS family permease